jgi:hypothetical protein
MEGRGSINHNQFWLGLQKVLRLLVVFGFILILLFELRRNKNMVVMNSNIFPWHKITNFLEEHAYIKY